jgi:16S rRNA (guanine527-N7)-methyltransferase
VARKSAEAVAAAGPRLRQGATALGVDLDDAAIQALSRYLDELELWNARMNLVGEHDRRSLIDRHVVDALAAVPTLRSLGTCLRIADVGSGAGLPGVPLAIALRPGGMWLIEPRKKRASFLRSVRRALPELRLEVVENRGEVVARRPGLAGTFDAVVSRATLDDRELLACAAPLLREGGLLVAYRGTGDAGAQAAPGPLFEGPVAHRYTLTEARREFRLDVWTRRFT